MAGAREKGALGCMNDRARENGALGCAKGRGARERGAGVCE